MMPAKHDIQVYRGDSKTIVLTLNKTFDEDGVQTTEPVDLTGHVFTSEIRPDVNSTEVVADFECTVTDAEAGKVRLYMSPAKAQNLNIVNMVWDVQSVDADGEVQTWVKGTVNVSFDVTRV